MKVLLFLALASAATAAVNEGAAWASVPASREARNLEAFTLPGALTENVVKLIGQDAAVPLPVPLPVIAVNIAAALPEPAPAASTAEAHPVPTEALWPDAQGRIAEPEPWASGEKEMRNPWEIRIRPKATTQVFEFTCGGIIAGGEGGIVALVNGRIVKAGARLEGFVVSKVEVTSVVVKRDRVSFVLPLGRHVTITTVDR